MSSRAFFAFSFTTAIGVLGSIGCSKSNDLDVQGGQGEVTCSDGASCSGACVEGICREFCDSNYQCPARESCVTIENEAVCVPEEDDFVYAPYEPLDLLSQCSDREGCQASLDAVELRGSFRECLAPSVLLVSDSSDTSFDFDAACAEFMEDSRLDIGGRRSYSYYQGRCDTAAASGMAGADTLVEACFGNDGGEHTNFSRVVERGGDVYLWRGGPYPHSGPEADDWYSDQPDFFVSLWKRVATEVETPASCTNENFDCKLPTFPRLGAAASSYAGLWVQCDQNLPTDCDASWAGKALNDFRTVIYVREDGFGELMQKAGDAYDPQPRTCTAAFRQGGDQQVLILGHHDVSIGTLAVQRRFWAPVTADGYDYLLEYRLGLDETTFDPDSSSPTASYRKVPFPDGFEDPCEGHLPQFKF